MPPAPEITPDCVPVAEELSTLNVKLPALAIAPDPEMPPVPAAVSVRLLDDDELVMPALRMIPFAALSVSP